MSPRRREGTPRPTADTLLAAALRDEILTGALAPGTPLREEDLAGSHEVSRHTVRAALATLHTERLVQIVPYAGARVTTFDDAAVAGLQELRAALESEAVRLVTQRHGAVWPTEVEAPVLDAIERLGTAEAAGDWMEIIRAHADVHRRIVAASGSPRIIEAHASLESEVLLLLAHVRPHYSRGELAAEHRAYLAALPRHGSAGVHAHLRHSTELIRTARAASTPR